MAGTSPAMTESSSTNDSESDPPHTIGTLTGTLWAW
jgi:hypothetical protein